MFLKSKNFSCCVIFLPCIVMLARFHWWMTLTTKNTIPWYLRMNLHFQNMDQLWVRKDRIGRHCYRWGRILPWSCCIRMMLCPSFWCDFTWRDGIKTTHETDQTKIEQPEQTVKTIPAVRITDILLSLANGQIKHPCLYSSGNRLPLLPFKCRRDTTQVLIDVLLWR